LWLLRRWFYTKGLKLQKRRVQFITRFILRIKLGHINTLGSDLVVASAVVGLGPVVVAVATQVSAADPVEVESPPVLAVNVLPETALVAHYHLAQFQLIEGAVGPRAVQTYVVVGFSVAQSAAFTSLAVLVGARLDVGEHQLLPFFNLHARHWNHPPLSEAPRGTGRRAPNLGRCQSRVEEMSRQRLQPT
jgi:hypothetical protein